MLRTTKSMREKYEKIQNYISALIKQTIIYYIGLEKITHQNI